MNDLAGLYRDQGRYADAEPLYKRALAIYEKALGPDHPHVATSLNNLAGLYVNQGRYDAAEPLFKRALAISEKALGPDHPDVATSLNNLALLYRNQGRYDAAEPLYKRALAIYEKALGPDHPHVATSLNNLAGLYKNQGRYDAAEPLYKRTLAIYEKALGPDHPHVATSLNNLAELYYNQGRYDAAEPLFKRALAIKEKALGPDHPAVAISLNNLAELYHSQGRYDAAEPLLKRALAIKEKALGPDHPDVATSLNNLAELYHDHGRYDAAEPLFKRALAIKEKALGPDHPDVATSLNNLAGLYHSQGRYDAAEPLHKRALAISEKALGPDHPDVATSLNNLALLYDNQGRYAEALSLVRQSIARKFPAKYIAFPVLYQSQRQNLIGTADAFNGSYETLQRVSSSAASNSVSKLAARFAAGGGELSTLVRKDQDLTAEAERLDKVILAAVSKLPAERNATAEDQVRKRLDAIRLDRDQLQQIFNQRFPDYVALSKPQPLSLTDTQALLVNDEALVVLDFDDKSYAWIITRTSADWIELNISAQELDAQVKNLRISFKADSIRFDTSLAHNIYQATFGVFADKIPSKTRLSVVTNGAFTSLPLHLLITKDPSGKQLKDIDWLARSHAITIWPSVANMKVLRGKSVLSSAPKPLIAFADPVFSKQERKQAQNKVAMRSITEFYRGTQFDLASLGEALPQLPETRKEVQAVAKALNADPRDIKLGLAATETAVKQARLDQYRIVYFATHGMIAGDIEKFTKAKAEPALALTVPDRPDEQTDDGFLFASEITQLKLNADWVVLSACETATGDKPGAEALSGLARAFFYAGARSLVVSHWKVEDEHTARLMTNTFQAIARNIKLTHAQALQQAMLAMIKNAKSDAEAHPRLWAPFVVVGEPSIK